MMCACGPVGYAMQGAQLQELLKLLPVDATEQRVELCSKFWGRLTDRAKSWSDVMRSLTAEQQVGFLVWIWSLVVDISAALE